MPELMEAGGLNAYDFFDSCVEVIDGALSRAFSSRRLPPTLLNAMKYAVFPGGKRIRPTLGLAFCADLGGDYIKIATEVAAIELIHSSTLVHDDLPAMDNDDMRRGKPSCHKAFGEATAILVGDALLGLSFELLMSSHDAIANCLFSSQLSKAYTDVCAGQQLDMEEHGSLEKLKQLHTLKTGALFGASVAFGAIGSGIRDSGEVEMARELGSLIGVYFQIVDDLIDVRGTDVERGRVGGSDSRNQKVTAFRGAVEDPESFLLQAKSNVFNMLDGFGGGCGCRGTKSFPMTRALLSSIDERAEDLLRR